MKRCNIVLNGCSYINVAADRMEKEEDMLYVYDGANLVAVVDVSVILSAHISENGECYVSK